MIKLSKTQLSKLQIDLKYVNHPWVGHYYNNSSENISFFEDSNNPNLLAFTQRSQETTLKLKGQKKLQQKYQDILLKKIRLNHKIRKFLHLFHLEQFESPSAFIFYPSSLVIKIWNILYLIISVVQISLIPLTHLYPFLILVFIACKSIDVVINLCSTFAVNGQFVNNLTEITLNYGQKYLLFDMLFFISLSILILVQDYFWISVAIALISTIPRLLSLQNYLFYEYNLFHPVKQFIFLILKMLIFIHLLTCFWEFNCSKEDQIEYRYLHSLYISISIVGFNSVLIDQDDVAEVLTFCLFSFLSLLMFAYLLQKFNSIFKEDKFQKKLSHFLAENTLDTLLKHRIISHLTNQPKYHHNQFVQKLSTQLHQEYNFSQRSHLLLNYFRSYNKTVISEIINKSEEIVCSPNQLIYQEGKLDDCSLYFLLEGVVYLESRSQLKLITLTKGSSFGEIEFYTEFNRNYSVRSEGVTRILKIARQTFINQLTFNDKQLFYQTREQILFRNCLPNKCACCNSNSHLITQCPLLTYKASKDKIIKSHIFPHRQIRERTKRRQYKDMKALFFYQIGPQYEVAFLQLFSDQLQLSQVSQSQLPYDEIQVKDSTISARDRSLSKASREKSVIKSGSLMKQQSGYEQQSQPNYNDNIFFEPDHDFSMINSINEQYKLEEFNNLVRSDQQKRTFATAGFGTSKQDLTQKSLNVIIEHGDSDNNSQSNENLDDSIVQDKFQRNNKDPKLTFNYNFETQLNELEKQNRNLPRLSRLGSGSQRQLSSRNSTIRYPDVVSSRNHSQRSLTYSPIQSNGQQKQFFASSPKGIRKSTFSFPAKQMQSIRQFDAQNNDDAKSQSKRQSYRKISTKTGTKMSIIPSCFQPFSTLDNPYPASLGISNFDMMYHFENYLPHNNFTITIKMANSLKKKNMIQLSKYFLDYKIAKMIHQLKLKKLKSIKTKTQTKIE